MDPIADGFVYEELWNIVKNHPLWPGCTISHRTADVCGARGWAKRDSNGCWCPTEAGFDALVAWIHEERRKETDQ